MRKLKQRVLSLFLGLLMLCLTVLPAAAAASATGSNMRLAQYTGTVNVTNSSGRALSKRSNMQLYNGYNVETKAKSYAWINLDSTKLIKLDASSKVQIRKSGNKLELLLKSGHIYFNVTSPLKSGETLNIRTSTMVTGIRGTSGWIDVVDRWTSEIYVLEGSVQCNVTDPVTGQIKTTTVESGQKAVAVAYPQEREGDKCDFIQERIEIEDIGGFVLTELAQDPELCEEIYEASGLDVQEAAETARERLTRDEQEMQDKLNGIEDERAGQDGSVSTEPVWGDTNTGGTTGGGTTGGGTIGGGTTGDGTTGGGTTGGGTTGGGTTGGGNPGGDTKPTVGENVTKSITEVTAKAVQELLDTAEVKNVTLTPDGTGDSTLTIEDIANNTMTIPEGKTLTLSEGIDVTVEEHCSLIINGTMTGNGTLTVQDGGELMVNSSNTLEMTSVVNKGALINNGDGKIVANIRTTSDTTVDDPSEENSGYFASAGTIQGTVTVEGGYAVMTGGKINGGSSTAVIVTGGTFEITGGEITSSNASTTVSCSGSGVLNLNGGTITNSSGTGYALNISGSPDVTYAGTILRAKKNNLFISGANTPDNYTSSGPDGDGYYSLTKKGEVTEPEPTVVGSGDVGNVTWTLYDDGTLYISGTGMMEDSTTTPNNPAPWYNAYHDTITAVIIDDGVENIGNYAFYGCENLTTVDIPTSVRIIGDNAFYGCTSLIAVTIPEDDTKSMTIGNSVFYGCGNLTEVSIGSPVQSFGTSVFWNCTSLERVTMVSSDSPTLAKISIGRWTFYECSNLRSVTIPSNVTSIGSDAFYKCSSLEAVSIPDGVTEIAAEAFYGCSSLTDVNIPDSVTKIGESAFYNCKMSSVNIPSGITSIASGTFYSCTNLENVTIPDSVTSIGDNAFWQCSNLTGVIIGAGVGTIGDGAFAYCTELTSVTILKSTVTIQNNAFRYCNNLETVYYAGTEEEWEALLQTIGTNNDPLKTALNIYYDSSGPETGYSLVEERVTALSAAAAAHPFTDVPGTAWYGDAVQYVYDAGLMGGTGVGVFSPDSPLSRGMLVTILHRVEGKPSAPGADFTDVPAGEWYTDAVAWASANEIVYGYNGAFQPNDPITREQMAAILYRYAGYKEYDTAASGDASAFPDGGSVSAYAVDAVNWAVGAGLIQGSDGMLLPGGGATRAQAATILMRFCGDFAGIRTVTVVSAMDIMCEPSGILFLADGSFLVTDTYNNVVWRVANGVSTVYAGGDTVSDLFDRPIGGYHDAGLEDSYFSSPWAIVPYLDGYAVTDSDNNVVRLIKAETIQTVNGSTRENLTLTDLGVTFDHPTGLAADGEGNLYVSDTFQGAVRKITPQGVVTTFAGGLTDPMGLCWKDGTLYIAETGANRIVKTTGGSITVVAGSGVDDFVDGPAARAAFSAPQGVAVGDDGTIYVSDTVNGAVRQIKDGVVTTLAIRDESDLDSFIPTSPVGLAVSGGKLYVCDSFARKVFVIFPVS